MISSFQGGPNNTPPHAQYYQGYGPPYPAHHYPHHHPTTHHGASPHVHTGAPTHPHGTPTPPSCNNPSGPVHTGKCYAYLNKEHSRDCIINRYGGRLGEYEVKRICYQHLLIFTYWKHYLIDIFFLKVGKGSASLLPQPILMTKSKIKNFQILRQPFNWIEILLCDVTSWGFPVLKACTGKWNVTHQQ